MAVPPARKPQRQQPSLLARLGTAALVLFLPVLLYVAYWVLVFESDVPFISRGTFYFIFASMIAYLILALLGYLPRVE
ncbi:hypothetical protein KEM56_007658 [Ascosphaera pollenicola]|nr:hypothetical protein KEM56_007658 [Ascosphaera pollenicola]